MWTLMPKTAVGAVLTWVLVVVPALYKEIPFCTLNLAGRAVAGSSMSSQPHGTFFSRQEQRGIVQKSYFSRLCRLHGAIQWSGSVRMQSKEHLWHGRER